MKNKLLLVPLLFIFISCAKQPVQEIPKEPVKPTYYTVIVNGRSYKNLIIYSQNYYGEIFKTKDGRRVGFRGNYMFIEQLDGE